MFRPIRCIDVHFSSPAPFHDRSRQTTIMSWTNGLGTKVWPCCDHHSKYCSISSFRFHAPIYWDSRQYFRLIYRGRARALKVHRYADGGVSNAGDTRMFQKCTVSTVLAAILTITASAALAAPRQKQPPTINRPEPPTINRPAPISGAEWWQNRGIAEEMNGVPYRPRR